MSSSEQRRNNEERRRRLSYVSSATSRMTFLGRELSKRRRAKPRRKLVRMPNLNEGESMRRITVVESRRRRNGISDDSINYSYSSNSNSSCSVHSQCTFTNHSNSPTTVHQITIDIHHHYYHKCSRLV